MRCTGWVPVVFAWVLLSLFGCSESSSEGGAGIGLDDDDAPTIGRGGGELSLRSGAAIDVPRGALSATEMLAVERYEGALPPPPDGYSFAGDAYAFTPHGTRFDAPVTLRVPYRSTRLGKVVLRLDGPDAEAWEVLMDGIAYHKGIATLQVQTLSIYVVAHPGDPEPIACAQGQDACDGRCVDLRTDMGNCGLCRYRCDTRCAGGLCEVPLPPDCMADADCDDGQFCNGAETCQNGACVAGTMVDCDDGDFCNGTETCLGMGCQAGMPVDCDDGLFCNGTETCQGTACVAGTAVDCDDGDAMTVDSCNEAMMMCEHVGGDVDAGT